MDVLETHVLTEPNPQQVLDLFKGEWSSKLPDSLGLTTQPGAAGLFEDERIAWAEESLGSFANMHILELGPLEGGHSYMFQQRQAKQVVAIEANSRAFLKCLCIKEILKLDCVEFLLGDFMPYLEQNQTKYDMVCASGVLYHMQEPIKLLQLASQASDRLLLWTHYYDPQVIQSRPELSHKFGPVKVLNYDGVDYEYSTQSYKEALKWLGFCGGSKPISKWLTRESLMLALKQHGFTDIQINFDDPNHPNGPSLAICATK